MALRLIAAVVLAPLAPLAAAALGTVAIDYGLQRFPRAKNVGGACYLLWLGAAVGLPATVACMFGWLFPPAAVGLHAVAALILGLTIYFESGRIGDGFITGLVATLVMTFLAAVLHARG
ncbi:hypothetical protein [Alienimonas californiensis]|uniref:SPW repeat protein n=1 Tax=Alienimonas californiensis TaxID=2527989 RepID=A0A517P9S5_9PLAN|nr:hypothetical protein [Alienimonas californiensis]QDT16136.1 hypothetical protein CA12_22340 [Alienimonas californiensis]